MKLYFVLLTIVIFVGCHANPIELQVKEIFRDVDLILDEEAAITAQISQKTPVFGSESVNNFPNNRVDLAKIANEQIALYEQLIQLDEKQISKIASIETMPIDEKFIEYSKFSRLLVESYIESKKLRIKNFQLVSDTTITTTNQLQENMQKIHIEENELDLKIAELRAEKQAFRMRIGK